MNIKKELDKKKNDLKRNAMYKTTESYSTPLNLCNHKTYGCTGNDGHKTEVSKYCLYVRLKGNVLASSLHKWWGENTICE